VGPIERVAYFGDPEIRSVNVRLVREAGRRAQGGSESASLKVDEKGMLHPTLRPGED
jgi:hypothetical protein